MKKKKNIAKIKKAAAKKLPKENPRFSSGQAKIKIGKVRIEKKTKITQARHKKITEKRKVKNVGDVKNAGDAGNVIIKTTPTIQTLPTPEDTALSVKRTGSTGRQASPMLPTKQKSSYEAKDIYVLEGLEPVRLRPGMYIGSTGQDGLHHLIWEVADNCLDEFMSGYGNTMDVEILPDNKMKLSDNGRGIPVDIHKQTKKSALETVMCTLHAGGKFGGDSYKIAGGLHGVGVSVVNALSKWLKAEVCRQGAVYTQEYNRGKPLYKVKKAGTCQKEKTGTSVTFEPDSEVFKEIKFDWKKIIDHLREQAYLTSKVRINIIDKRSPIEKNYGFYFEGGLSSFLRYLIDDEPTICEPFIVSKEHDGVLVEIALVYTEDIQPKEFCFANNIHTHEGGMHLTGFRSSLTRTLNDYAWKNGYFKEGDDNLSGDDVREGLTAIVSVKIKNPQFEGQTKAKLGNPEARTATETVMLSAFTEFLEKNSQDARRIIEKCILALKARKAAKAAKETVLRKGLLDGLALPGKLADCSSRNPEESELFIVEGDSAGGCFSGDTKVRLIDGRNITFQELTEEYKNGKRNYCYTVNKDGNIGIAPIENPRITKKQAKVIKIILDNNEEIICTPDHKFMLRDGSYKMAKDLTKNDSLMPLYRKYSQIEGRITIKGYEMVFNPNNHKWIFTHLLSDRYNLERKIYSKEKGDTIHHIDFNKLNNNPDNLVIMPNIEHFLYHSEMCFRTLHTEEAKNKSRKIRQSQDYREKIKKIMTTPAMKKMLSERAKKQWQNEEYKNYMVQKFLEFYKNNAEYRKKNNKLLNEIQKAYWNNAVNRKNQAERVIKYFKENPERRKWLSGIAKQQWDNLGLKRWRSEMTKKQWTPEFREKRKKAYNRTYLKKALSAMRDVYQKNGIINRAIYNQIRKNTKDKSIIKYETINQRFFAGNENKLKEAVLNFNHRIKSIISLKEKMDVYDIEVPGTHNFALASGVFVHNSGKQGRDRRIQAILPLRGKILNVEKARLDKMLENKEVKALIIALGTAISEEFNIEKIRYHKVIITTDADVDGAHIKTLLLTLFFRYFPQIIEKGYLYIANPPLYRVQYGKDIHYAYSDAEKEKVIVELQKIKNQKSKIKITDKKSKINETEEKTAEEAVKGISIQRYKGLGEMNPEQLWETTMDPARRILKQVQIKDAAEADNLFNILMGEEVSQRKRFIQAYAKEVRNLDI